MSKVLEGGETRFFKDVFKPAPQGLPVEGGSAGQTKEKGMSDNIERKMAEYEKKFKEYQEKLKEADENIQKLSAVKQAIWDEMNVLKGRYNELKELSTGTNGKSGSELEGAKVLSGPGNKE